MQSPLACRLADSARVSCRVERKVAPLTARLPVARLAAGRDAALGALGRLRRLLPGAAKQKDS